MAQASDATVDPYTRWGVYATLGLYVLGLTTFAAGLTGVADVLVPGLFLWVVSQVAVALSTLADAFVLGHEGVDWGRRRYLYGLGALVVPPLVVLYIYHRRRRVRRALRRREAPGAAATSDDRSATGAADRSAPTEGDRSPPTEDAAAGRERRRDKS
ncbi:MAG: hypothetical protein ABEH47_03785 [Haloferacaceae archaeon]